MTENPDHMRQRNSLTSREKTATIAALVPVVTFVIIGVIFFFDVSLSEDSYRGIMPLNMLVEAGPFVFAASCAAVIISFGRSARGARARSKVKIACVLSMALSSVWICIWIWIFVA